jgi:hypothetical protein
MSNRYWFRPKRLGEFAAYYPVNFPGWVVTLSCFFFLIYFLVVDREIYTPALGLFHFFLEAVVILLIYDLFCFRTGEYPSWWSGHRLRHRVHRHHPANRAHRKDHRHEE